MNGTVDNVQFPFFSLNANVIANAQCEQNLTIGGSRGCQGRAAPDQISFIFIQFSEKILPNDSFLAIFIGFSPPPPICEILDLPLVTLKIHPAPPHFPKHKSAMHKWTHPSVRVCPRGCGVHHYRLQKKFAKVMFLQVSVCPYGGTCMAGGHVWLGGCVWLGGHAWLGACIAGGVHGWGCAW